MKHKDYLSKKSYINKFLLLSLIYTLTLFSTVKTIEEAPSLYQMIWYESTSMYKSDLTVGSLQNQDYHIIKMRIGDAATIFDTPPTNYIALIKRNNGVSNVDVQLFKDEEVDKYTMFTFFLLNLKGNHIKNRKYLIWNVSCNSTTGIVTYNIKFFTCDTVLDTFYSGITANNKVKNYGNSLEVDNIVVTSGFANSQALLNALTTNSCKA